MENNSAGEIASQNEELRLNELDQYTWENCQIFPSSGFLDSLPTSTKGVWESKARLESPVTAASIACCYGTKSQIVHAREKLTDIPQ